MNVGINEQERSRGKDKRHSSHETGRLGGARAESSVDRLNSNQATDSDCSREHNPGKSCIENREAALGGILSQLKLLQQDHLAYVQAHEQRLVQRLEENREHQKQVLARMNALEEEVVHYLNALENEDDEDDEDEEN